METTESYEAWLFPRFPGNRALNLEQRAEIKDIDLLNEAHFPTPSLKEKNLSWCCQDALHFAALKQMPGECRSSFLLVPSVIFIVF